MLSKNFHREEFECRCQCGMDIVDAELISTLQELRDHYNKKITISSGCRCPAHNAAIGGAVDSFHTKAKAADIKVANTPPIAIYHYIDRKYPNKYGLILYKTFVHIDVRPNKYRKIKGEGHGRNV